MGVPTLSLLRIKIRAALEGTCASCSLPAAEGRKFCDEHLLYQRTHHREARAARKAAGLCIQCGAAAGPASTIYCERCRVAANERHRTWTRRAASRKARNAQHKEQRRLRLLREGLCVKCGGYRDSARLRCHRCTSDGIRREGERRAENRAQGKCRCGRKPQPGMASCRRCRRRSREAGARLEARRRELGQCRRCHRRAISGRAICAHHNRMELEGRLRRARRRAGKVLR